MKKIIYFIIFFLGSFFTFSQPENPTVEIIDGKKFYVHIVEAGNTLYGMTKLYKVSAEKILEFNPAASNGLQINQKIIIPVDANQTAPTVTKAEKKAPEIHKVVKGDNLYNVSKRYSITMEDIVQLNPGSENGISIDQELKLPKHAKIIVEQVVPVNKVQISFSDSVITYTVLPHETMYSLSKRFMIPVEEIQTLNELKNTKIRKGDIIRIPVKKEKVTKVEIRKVEDIKKVEEAKNKKIDDDLIFKSKQEYQIVYLLPFALDGGNDNLRQISTEFLMGAQLALDSLESMGLKAKIQVIDAATDTIKFKEQLNSNELKKADLIFGPFHVKTIQIAADWAKQNKIRLVSPLLSSTSILQNNSLIYNAVNSDITLIEGAAKYIAENKVDHQIVLVKVNSKDNELYVAFRMKLMKSLSDTTKIKIIECNQSEIGNHIKKGGNTIFVVPSRDKAFSTRFINALDKVSSKAGSGTITIFGTKDWANNDDIKGYSKNKYNLHFASPYDFNYSDDLTKKMLKKYRVKYNADLSKYSLQGFDVSMYFIQEFFLNKPQTKGIMNKISLKSVAPGSGYENKTCFILKQEDYELKQVGVINE